MDDKKKLIIEAATKFFSEKGYYSTSVQEIAEYCGMSKGSIYKLFSSKEDLLIDVFEHFQNIMFAKAAIASDDSSLTPKELLIKQMSLHIADFMDKKEFILMQMKETPRNDRNKPQEILIKMKARVMNWQRECLLTAYGKDIEPYIWDLVVMILGSIKEYIHIVLREKRQEDIESIARFIVERVDSVVSGLLKDKPQPLLTNDRMSRFVQNNEVELLEDKVESYLKKLEDIIATFPNQST